MLCEAQEDVTYKCIVQTRLSSACLHKKLQKIGALKQKCGLGALFVC